jgi:hypothetical protein
MNRVRQIDTAALEKHLCRHTRIKEHFGHRLSLFEEVFLGMPKSTFFAEE